MNDLNEYFHTNDDGSYSILVDAQNLHDVLLSLSHHNIHVLRQRDAIFRDAKVLNIELALNAKAEDIKFALDNSVKFIRPFPK